MDKIVTCLFVFSLLLLTGCGSELVHRADSSFHEGDYQKSSELYEQYLAKHPDAFLTRRKYGLALLKAGHADKAVEQFKKVIEDRPQDASSFLYLGLAYLRLGEYRNALSIWQHYTSGGRPLIAEEVERQSERIVAAGTGVSKDLANGIEAEIENAILAQKLRNSYNASRLEGCGAG